jgi:hypothetical protein
MAPIAMSAEVFGEHKLNWHSMSEASVETFVFKKT